MACPYFMPVEKLENGNWPHPARLPLGAGWNGHCTAPDHAGKTPSLDILEAFCNLGYAGSCSWAPADRDVDAVRFAVIAPPDAGPGKKSSSLVASNTIRVKFVRERAHRPVNDGELEFDLRSGIWLRRHDDACLQKMAECYLHSYLQKKA